MKPSSMKLSFSPLTIERRKREEYSSLFALCGERASDYSFTNIWGWSEERRYEWAFHDGLCWLRLTGGPAPVWWAPVGNWNRPDWAELLNGLFPSGAVFERVPQTLAGIWREQLRERLRLEEQRSEWEYLYSCEKMIALSGNRLHKKKNLLNQFRKFYDYTYAPICGKRIEAIRAMQEEWFRWRGCEESPGLAAENTAIARVLNHWEELPGILGGSLSVRDAGGGDRTVAYTVAEDLGDGTVVIHFEKGLDSCKGVYQAINQIFLEQSRERAFTFVNREQDMGIEGIRQAKESYGPVGFLKKYKAFWLGGTI
ncbi:MAG: phosphatidylglycerol lysyltransferase domain-containing protein [Synergistaceae bacterium]|nr:phosphatidylglycerol lysyltransferase domain-containing protein [Synergistaceae bacterium]